MPPEFDPAAIVDVLNRHDVRYVVIGGYAANVHGAKRPTLDIDVTPQQTRDNLERLVAAMVELEAKTRGRVGEEPLPFAVTADDLMPGNRAMLNLATKYGELDVSMVPQGTEGYDDLIRGAETRTLRTGISAKVASLTDVIRSKATANRPKDQAALPELRALSRLVVEVDQGPTDEEVAGARRAPSAQTRPATEAPETAAEDARARAARYLRERNKGAGP